jgi:hypothetical protein
MVLLCEEEEGEVLVLLYALFDERLRTMRNGG